MLPPKDPDTPKKKVGWLLGNNEAHSWKEYKTLVEEKPELPWDAEKEPEQSILKFFPSVYIKIKPPPRYKISYIHL
ncbi:hypothetical protein WDU94_014950 [Cyamophila willieti]